MQIGRIEGATRVIGKAQGCLPIRDEPLNCSVGGPNTPSMVTAWLPTPKEIEAIVAGAYPPIIVEVGDVPA